MNCCIYCSENIEKQRTKEHVFPANLGGEICLPADYVCDECNNYFARMDKTFLLNNYIATTVLTEEILNRNGKIRYKISDRVSYLGKRQFALTLAPIDLLKNKSATIKITQSKEFNELLFARAVHKIAFNCFAYEFGDDALDHRFNKLRKYIRKPNKGELWTYVVWPEPYLEFGFGLHRTNMGLLAEVRLLCLDFIVSLEGWRSGFEKLIPENEEAFVIRETGQWQASTFLGLKRAR